MPAPRGHKKGKETAFVLSDYLQAALEQAEYDKLSDGTFSGRIAACPGVVAFAPTLKTCERELRSTLEDWLLLGLKQFMVFGQHRLAIPSNTEYSVPAKDDAARDCGNYWSAGYGPGME